MSGSETLQSPEPVCPDCQGSLQLQMSTNIQLGWDPTNPELNFVYQVTNVWRCEGCSSLWRVVTRNDDLTWERES